MVLQSSIQQPRLISFSSPLLRNIPRLHSQRIVSTSAGSDEFGQVLKIFIFKSSMLVDASTDIVANRDVRTSGMLR